MPKPINVFMDNCVFGHSILNSDELSNEHEWLKNEIYAIRDIIELKKACTINIEYDLNVMIEMHQSGKDRDIKKLWGDVKPSPTFVNFQGVMINPEELKETTEWLEKRLHYLEEILEDNSIDITHLVQAEAYGSKYFVTTDRKLIKKICVKDKNILKVKVLSPSELLREIK